MVAATPDEPASADARGGSLASRLWRRWGWAVRWGGTALGVAYVSRLIQLPSLRAAFGRVSPLVLMATTLIIASGLALGALRWRVLLRAYGAQSRPALGFALRLYFEGVFYNTYLPGAVAGDVVRAIVTRDSFGQRGATGAIAVVFVERALGLFALFSLIVTGVALSGDAIADPETLRWGSLLGGAGALFALALLPLGRSLARFLPRPLARIASRLPTVERPLDFARATAMSVGTQLVAVLAGWMILRELRPAVTLADTLLIVPAAAATAFLPFTIGGTGAREGVFILLGGQLLGMTTDEAVAASLLMWASTLIVGAFGGLLLLRGRKARAPEVAAS